MKRLALLLLLALPLAAQTFTPIRVKAGDGPYTDSKKQVWATDNGFSGGNTTPTYPPSVTGTADPQLYLTQRWGLFSYSFSVPNGPYTLNLYFAETYAPKQKVGARVFSVTVNGATVLNNFDVFAKVGANAADIESIPVTVTTGTISIKFVCPVPDPFVNAIEILSASPPPPPPPIVFTLQNCGPNGANGGTCTFSFSMFQPPTCTATAPCLVEVCDNSTPINCLTLQSGGTISIMQPGQSTIAVTATSP